MFEKLFDSSSGECPGKADRNIYQQDWTCDEIQDF